MKASSRPVAPPPATDESSTSHVAAELRTAVLKVAADGRVGFANRSAGRLFGHTPTGERLPDLFENAEKLGLLAAGSRRVLAAPAGAE